MILYEYEGKELLSTAGIKVPKSQVIKSPSEAVRIQIPFVVKAQTLSGRRGKAGGIVIVETEKEIQKTLEEIFEKKINGESPSKILVEEKIAVRPSSIGKWSTTLQLFTLAVALVTLHDANLLHPYVLAVFIALSAAATVASGLQYLYRGLIWLQNRAPSITPPG